MTFSLSIFKINFFFKLNISKTHFVAFSRHFFVQCSLSMKNCVIFFFTLWCRQVLCMELDCGFSFVDECWNSSTKSIKDCWGCQMINADLNLTNGEVVYITSKHSISFDITIEVVTFHGGSFTFLPTIRNTWNNQQITQVLLFATTNTVLHNQFFSTSAEILTSFWYNENFGLSVKDGAFENCSNLESLAMSMNDVGHIESSAFRGLRKLITLDLSANQLKSVDPEWFRDLANLEVLELSSNLIKELSDDVFTGLSKLQELYLFKNDIEIISRRILKHNIELREINLSGNKIRGIQDNSYAVLSKLMILNLWDNICINFRFYNQTISEIHQALAPCRCIVPSINNGYTVDISDRKYQPPLVPYFSALTVKCFKSYGIFLNQKEENLNVCLDGLWLKPWATCQSNLIT